MAQSPEEGIYKQEDIHVFLPLHTEEKKTTKKQASKNSFHLFFSIYYDNCLCRSPHVHYENSFCKLREIIQQH